MKRAWITACVVEVLVVVVVVIVGCELPAAGFGRACDGDDDCVDVDSALVCRDSVCVSQAYLDAIVDEGPKDPDDPEDPDVPLEPTGETCADALPLALGVAVSGTTGAALNDHSAICGGANGADRAYVVQLATTTNLRITLNTGGFDASLYASTDDGCAFDTVIAGGCSDDASNVVDGEELQLFGVGPGEIFIVVDGANQNVLATSGAYTITVREDVACAAGFVPVDGRCYGIQGEVEQVVARTNATATLLDDGRVLVVGGRSGPDLEPTPTAEIFDPATSSFTATGSMATARARHAAERLADGRVLVIGGVSDDGSATATVEVWDPQTNAFSAAPSLPRRRDLTTATQLGGGRGVLVVGGRDGASTLSDVLTIDGALTAWTSRGTLGEPRYGHLTVLFDGDDEVLVIGGRSGGTGIALDSVESFDPRSGSLSSMNALPAARAAAAGAIVDQGHIAVFGGYEGNSDDGFVGKASAVVWSDGDGDWSDIDVDMVEPRLFATATFVLRLGIVVAGGSQDVPTASMELFVDGGFVALPPLRRARLAHSAVGLLDGRVLMVGGDGGDETETVPLDVAEIFGPQL